MYFLPQTSLLFLLAMYGKLADGYSSGAPIGSCTNMRPQHGGLLPQRSNPPFEIAFATPKAVNPTYTDGEQIPVTLRFNPRLQTAVEPFKGFMIRAVTTSNNIVGSFVTLPPMSKYMQCQGASGKHTITHSRSMLRGPIIFTWTSPPGNMQPVKFVATVVANYSTFWMNVGSAFLQYVPRQPVQQPQNPNPQNPGPFQQSPPQQPPPLHPLQSQLPPQLQGQRPQSPFQQPQPGSRQHLQPPQLPQLNPGPSQQPFQPQNVPPFQPQPLPPLQPLPPFQPNQPQSPFQRPPIQPRQPSHDPVPTFPTLRSLPVAFTPKPAKSTTAASPSVLKKDSQCGITKGCHVKCTDNECEHIVTWKDMGEYVEFELAAKLQEPGDQWISIGLSDDLLMGNDEVMECISDNGIVDVFHSFNIGKSNTPSTIEKLGLSNTEGSFINGIFKCKFRRTKLALPSSNQQDTLFDLTKYWHLMFGHGPAYQGYDMGMHKVNPIVTKNKIDFQSVVQGRPAPAEQTSSTSTASTTTTDTEPEESGKLIQDGACSVTKGCYMECKGSKCSFIVSWKDNPLHTDFEIMATMQNSGNQWTAIGFSDDLKMGNDEVIECVSNDDKVDVFRSFNFGTSNRRSSEPKFGLENIKGSFTDDVFRCSFRRLKDNMVRSKRSTEDSRAVDLGQNWYLMFGTGPASTEYNKRMHTKNPKVSEKKVDFQSLEVIGGSAGYPLIKAHACLMIIAWILFTGVGIVAARYCKTVWVTSSFMGQKIWFQIHRTCMVLVLVLTLIGFIIIFIEAGGYSQIAKVPGKEFTQAHPVLGIIVTILCIGNPIMSYFRPGPKDKNRPIFNWAHWAVGMLAHVLSIITICFGMEMEKSKAPEYAVWVVVGYVIYHILMELFMKTFDVCVDRPETADKRNTYEMKNKTQNGTTENGSQPPTYAEVNRVHKKDPKDSLIKKVLFLVHVIFAVAFTLTLVLLVVMY